MHLWIHTFQQPVPVPVSNVPMGDVQVSCVQVPYVQVPGVQADQPSVVYPQSGVTQVTDYGEPNIEAQYTKPGQPDTEHVYTEVIHSSFSPTHRNGNCGVQVPGVQVHGVQADQASVMYPQSGVTQMTDYEEPENDYTEVIE